MKGITLTKYILDEQEKITTGQHLDLAHLIYAIQTAIKSISFLVRRPGMNTVFGVRTSHRLGYEEQNLVTFANKLLINALKSTFSCSVLISSEEEDAIIIESEKQGDYIVCFDPLDGTQNIDCLVSIGTIFAIYSLNKSRSNSSSNLYKNSDFSCPTYANGDINLNVYDNKKLFNNNISSDLYENNENDFYSKNLSELDFCKVSAKNTSSNLNKSNLRDLNIGNGSFVMGDTNIQSNLTKFEPLKILKSTNSFTITEDLLKTGQEDLVSPTFKNIERLKMNLDKTASKDDALRGGRELIAAGYALYSSATVLVYSMGLGVKEFILDPSIGEFVLTCDSIQIPSRGHVYSINEGYSKYWYEPIKQYIHGLKNPKSGSPYSARYIGSMVADVHRTFKYGGIFMYPATKDCPKGKLRLLYECIPMAFLIEQAGGLAIDGEMAILDIKPESIHQRTPIYLGSKKDVQDVLNCFNKFR